MFYREQCVDLADAHGTGKTEQKKPKVLPNGPSLDRQKARKYNLRQRPVPTHTYLIIPEKLKQNSSSEYAPSSDSEATILVTPLTSDHENSQSPSPPSKPTPKGQFNTKTFGVKKGIKKYQRKRTHNYPCKLCKLSFSTMTEFNSHFKENHDPVVCDVCSLSFNTPSTLKHHAYTHKELRHACSKSEKKFLFSSDRDIYMISHET